MTTVYAGQIILADHNNDALTYAIPLTATKPLTTSRNTVTATAADPDLSLTIPAGGTWDFELPLLLSSAANAAGDFLCELGWTGTASVPNVGIHGLHNTLASGSQADLEGAGVSNDSTSPTAAFVVGTSTSTSMALIKGHILTSTVVVLTLNWAQFSSNANNTNLLQGSTFTARRRS